MPSEFWLVLTVAAAFLLLGIAGSPLAWVVLYHRRSRLEIAMHRKYQYLFVQLRELEDRFGELESVSSDGARGRRLGAKLILYASDQFPDEKRLHDVVVGA